MGADTRVSAKLRGNDISMIFQEPMSSLNPLHDIEKQISEVIQLHRGLSRKAACVEDLRPWSVSAFPTRKPASGSAA